MFYTIRTKDNVAFEAETVNTSNDNNYQYSLREVAGLLNAFDLVEVPFIYAKAPYKNYVTYLIESETLLGALQKLKIIIDGKD